MSKRITYCQMTYNRLHETMRCIQRVRPYVDRIVIVDGGSTDDTIVTLRNTEGIELYIHPWEDNFSKQRTNYLDRAGQGEGTDWVLVSDPDELFSEEACKNLRGLIEGAGKYNMIAFESHSVTMMGDKMDRNQEDRYWKPLLFRYNDGIHYIGNPHETLIIKGGPIIQHAPYHYYHIKQQNMTWHRGARNAFIGGGGPNLGQRHVLWQPFLKLCKEVAGIETWHDFNKYMVKGNMDKRIKDEILEFRKEDGYDGASEWREIFKTYFYIYHPEELPEEIKGEHIS